MKLLKLASAAMIAFTASAAVNAQTINVKITNLTHGQAFTPRLVVAHDRTIDTFNAGETASQALTYLAEAGVIRNADAGTPIVGQTFEGMLGPENTNNGSNTWRQFGGLVPPSQERSYDFDTRGFKYLSVLSMLIPTNDAFLGLDSIVIPTEPGTYTYNVNAYDAGTELNDELNPGRSDLTGLGGFNAPGVAGAGNPERVVDVGTGGTGVAAQVSGGTVADGTDGPVHIHRNVLGDTNATGGASDLDSRVHRWLNPVARITITVP